MQLLERTSQLQALNSALQNAADGQGAVALVYGEAGIGKSSLVDEFVREKDHTWRIWSGGCDLLFTPRPLGPMGDIALQARGRLLSLLKSGTDRVTLFAECLAELKKKPTILVIEDIHWADEATVDLLKYLGRRIRQTACLMILTYRDDEIGAESPLRLLLGDLASLHGVQRVPLSALSVDAVREMARGKKVSPEALHRLTSGNPFFLTEILAGNGGIPPSVLDAMLARVARLSPPAREVLDIAALIGLRAEADLLTRITVADAPDIEECIAAGLMHSQDDFYAFRHELARQAILGAIPTTRRRELSRRILAALKQFPPARGDLARLASCAEATGDAEAVLECAPAAARQAAAVGAHRQAVTLYELALKYADMLPPEQHAQMLETYADERRFRGGHDVLVKVRRQVIERYRALGDELRLGRNLTMLVSELHWVGRNAEAEEAIAAALQVLEPLPPSIELAQLYGTQCYLLGQHMDYWASNAAGRKAIAMAERFDNLEFLSRVYALVGSNLLCMGDEEGERLMERSLAIARQHELDYAIGSGLSNMAGAMLANGRYAEARRLVQECVTYTAQHDDDYHGADMPAYLAEIELYQGNWTEAAASLARILQQPRAGTVGDYWLCILGRLGVRRGDADAEQTLHRALAACTRAWSLESMGVIQAGLAESAWLRGDVRETVEHARAGYDLFAGQHVPNVTGELAFWLWRAGEVFTPPDWIAKPYALQIAGDWQAAAQEWEARGCPYERAGALMDGGEPAQLEALRIFESLGARPITELLKRRLRLEGVRGIPRGPRPATRENFLGLTAREMEVLACLVRGCSNNRIAAELSLSVRTVEHHIASMLQKTGAQSRGELIALAVKEHVLPVP